MSLYYVNDSLNENGLHEVHEEGCPEMSKESNCSVIGEYFSDIEAVEYCIKNYYRNSDGCYLCCSEAHRG